MRFVFLGGHPAQPSTNYDDLLLYGSKCQDRKNSGLLHRILRFGPSTTYLSTWKGIAASQQTFLGKGLSPRPVTETPWHLEFEKERHLELSHAQVGSEEFGMSGASSGIVITTSIYQLPAACGSEAPDSDMEFPESVPEQMYICDLQLQGGPSTKSRVMIPDYRNPKLPTTACFRPYMPYIAGFLPRD